IHNRFRILASNRGKSDTRMTFSLAGLPAGHIVGMDQGITLQPGETLQREFDIAADAAQISPGINHMNIVAHVIPSQKDDVFAETFITPMESAPSVGPAVKQQ